MAERRTLHGFVRADRGAGVGRAAGAPWGVGAIKWPNDLIVGSRKLAGVLPKLVFRGHQVRLARIGVGLNVRNPVPRGGIALRELLPPGRCRLRFWQLNALLALERASVLAADPQRVVDRGGAATVEHVRCRSGQR